MVALVSRIPPFVLIAFPAAVDGVYKSQKSLRRVLGSWTLPSVCRACARENVVCLINSRLCVAFLYGPGFRWSRSRVQGMMQQRDNTMIIPFLRKAAPIISLVSQTRPSIALSISAIGFASKSQSFLSQVMGCWTLSSAVLLTCVHEKVACLIDSRLCAGFLHGPRFLRSRPSPGMFVTGSHVQNMMQHCACPLPMSRKAAPVNPLVSHTPPSVVIAIPTAVNGAYKSQAALHQAMDSWTLSAAVSRARENVACLTDSRLSAT